VRLAAENDYDLILMDLKMPRLDGLAVAREILRRPGQHPPIVALTANAFEEDRACCLEAGMADFITKPISAESLFPVVLRWLKTSDS